MTSRFFALLAVGLLIVISAAPAALAAGSGELAAEEPAAPSMPLGSAGSQPPSTVGSQPPSQVVDPKTFIEDDSGKPVRNGSLYSYDCAEVRALAHEIAESDRAISRGYGRGCAASELGVGTCEARSSAERQCGAAYPRFLFDRSQGRLSVGSLLGMVEELHYCQSVDNGCTDTGDGYLSYRDLGGKVGNITYQDAIQAVYAALDALPEEPATAPNWPTGQVPGGRSKCGGVGTKCVGK